MAGQDIIQEARRILTAAEQQGILLRLFGGLAVNLHSPSAQHRSLSREYADIDFMGLRRQGKEIRSFFPSLGYSPREIFNALQGDRRLVFQDLENNRRIDVFLDVFEMCHRLDFRDRLTIDPVTIPLADLLATKLQVVEITDREYKDVIALIHDHDLGDSDAAETINGQYLAQLCADDWGIYKTFTTNISNILNAISQFHLETEDEKLVRNRLQKLLSMIENAPKSMRWKVRARLGEKVRWYELPEADKKIVDVQSGLSGGPKVE